MKNDVRIIWDFARFVVLLHFVKPQTQSIMLVIGIAGGTGSGKTTIAKKLYQIFKKQAVILPHDFY